MKFKRKVQEVNNVIIIINIIIIKKFYLYIIYIQNLFFDIYIISKNLSKILDVIII